MTLKLRLALLGLLSISATVSTERGGESSATPEPCACAQPEASAPRLSEAPRTVEARIISITDDHTV